MSNECKKQKTSILSTNDSACLAEMKKESIDYALSNIEIGSTLGNIGVDIQFLIYEINSLMKTLSAMAESNMAFSEETSASMNEINSAIEQNITTIERIIQNIENIIKSNKENIINTELMSSVCKKVSQGNQSIDSNLQILMKKIREMGNIINIIEDIANQTNLLSLNASIEAARAGESGRGFAVVAGEIRKLAEDTKESLSQFQEFKDEIEDASKNSIQSIEEANKTMQEIPVATGAIKEIVENTFNSINTINEDMNSFMASFEQISASTSQVSNAVHNMATETEKVTVLVDSLNNSTDELENVKQKINHSDKALMDNNKKYYASFLNLGSRITDKQLVVILKDAKIQHEAWMATLRKAVENGHIIPLQVDSTRCGFGHFYQSLKIDDNRIIRLWNEIDKHHESLHNLGLGVLTALTEKDFKTANEKYSLAKNASGQVFKIIDDIILELSA